MTRCLPKHKEKFYGRIGTSLTIKHFNAKSAWDHAVNKLDATQVMRLHHDEIKK